MSEMVFCVSSKGDSQERNSGEEPGFSLHKREKNEVFLFTPGIFIFFNNSQPSKSICEHLLCVRNYASGSLVDKAGILSA